jgi:membrane fusion protein (multidrug efflux system)
MTTSPEPRPSGSARGATASAPAIDEGRRSTAGQAVPAKPARNAGRTIAIVIGAAVVAGVVFGYWWSGRKYEDTDDAQIDGNISNVGTRVAGTVTSVHVVENQQVHVGDPLLEIDAADLAVEVKQARAAVALAEAQLQAEDPSVSITETSNTAAVAGATSELAGANAGVSGSQKDVDQLAARLVEAQGNLRLAELERRRALDLWKGQAIPRADVDRRVTTAETAAADVQAIQQSLAAARQRVLQQKAQLVATRSRLVEVRKNAPRQVETRRASVLSRQANLELARAQLAQAELNAGYASLRSPVDGVIAKKSVSVGDHVAPGQQLVAIAQTNGLWVTANFRETQVQHMQPGQTTRVHVDALDGDLTGRIESLGAATGSRMSLLPPENASGNYVKVVQRIPVRIHLDPGQAGLERLRPGMSAEPKVRIAE